MTLATKIVFIAALLLSIVLPFCYFYLGEKCKKRYKRTLGVNTVFFFGTLLIAMAVMFTIEWRLALTLAVVLPLCLWFTLSQRIRMKKANIEVKKKTADITQI